MINNTIATGQAILDSDQFFQQVTVTRQPPWKDVESRKIVISFSHAGILKFLKDSFPGATIVEIATEKNIRDKYVIGELPALLIPYCQSFRAVEIKEYHHIKDKDLLAVQLLSRLVTRDPIQVTVE